MKRIKFDLIEMKLDDCDIKMRRMSSMTVAEADQFNSLSADEIAGDLEKAMVLMKMFFVSSSDGRTQIFDDMPVADFINFTQEWSDLHTPVELDDE